MSSPTCDRAALVEAMLDGRLGPPDQASVERHLKTCAACSELLRELTALRQTLRSSPRPIAPLAHHRARLALLRQAAAPPVAPRRPVGLLAAALVTLPLVVWAASSLSSGSRGVVPVVTAPMPPGVTTPASAPTRGEPAATTSPSVATTAPPPVVSAVNSAPTALPAANATNATNAPTAAPRSPAPSSSDGPRRPHNEAGERPAPGAATPPATPPATPSAMAPVAAPSSGASQEFADAMDALSRGDFGASAGKLSGFASAHPRDPRAEEAAYLQAIALERAGRLPEAQAAARRYLAAYPDGAHRAQARRLAGD